MRCPSSRIFCIAVIEILFTSYSLITPIEELAAAAHRLDALEQQSEVAVLADEVQPLGVYDQDMTGIMIKEAAVAVGEQRQVLRCDGPLELHPASPHPFVQRLRLCVEVDHEVGLGRLRAQRLVDLLVQMQLVAGERQAREEGILLQ